MNEYLNLLEFIKHFKLNMVLNNEIIKYDEFELINRDELFEDFILDFEDDDYCDEDLEEMFIENTGEVYQYFIVDASEVDYWLDYTDYPVYYSEELDLYLVGITHLGMSWEYFDTTCPRPTYLQ